MPYGMYISAAGAQVQSQRLQVLSNNLANASTPGFKRDWAIFQARHAEEIERGRSPAGTGSLNDLGGGVSVAETVTDFHGGTVRQTGNPHDLALRGDGFFLVAKEGEQFLTRAGNFHLTSNGRLTTESGHDVLASDRQPVVANPNLPATFDDQGFLVQAGARIPLALVNAPELHRLSKAGDTLFSTAQELEEIPVADRSVRAGFLEQSSVQPAQEMIELIETSRVYEANIRMIQNQDQLLGSLINRVLRV